MLIANAILQVGLVGVASSFMLLYLGTMVSKARKAFKVEVSRAYIIA